MTRRLRKLAVLNRVLALRETRALQRLLEQRRQLERDDDQKRKLAAMQADYRSRLRADEGAGLSIGNLRLGRRFDSAMADAVDGQSGREQLSRRQLAPAEAAWQAARARRQGGEDLLRRRERDGERREERRQRSQSPPRRSGDDS